MINPKDLRIGNYLRIKGSDTIIQVEPYLLSISELINYKAVVLTPEILEKCGFVMHMTKQLWKNGNFYLHHYLVSNNEYCFKYRDFTSSSIQYLHQLQNLYFALTGTELNYQP